MINKVDLENMLNQNCVIVLDTNVYLNIYERSPEFSTFSIKVLDEIRELICLPTIVKREFFKNYRSCFEKQKKKIENSCKKIQSQLEATKAKISNQCEIIKRFQFPDIDELKNKIDEEIACLVEIVESYSQEHDILELVNEHFMENDKVLELVQWLCDNNKIMDDFTVDDLFYLTKEADKRYEQKLPPGFKDKKEGEGLGKYGDFLIWEQTIRFSEANKKSVIFVTDDLKCDWYERMEDEDVFHHALTDEFVCRTGVNIIGINSLDFLNIVSDIFHIEKSDAITYALEFTADDYIENLVNNDIFYDVADQLVYSGDEYIDMGTLSASATEGIEISEEFDSVEFVKYEIENCDEDEISYLLTFELQTTATSYEYWGRDDDTKEIIRSPGMIHILKGEIIVEVTRDICMEEIVDGDTNYKICKIVYGDLKEIESYDSEDLCVQCGENIGCYFNKDGEPICDKCMVTDSEGEICPKCGRKFPQRYMAGSFCLECENVD